MDSIANRVKDNYDSFKKKEGAQHIATLSSQYNLAVLLLKHEPKQILDYGAGIGTLTSLCFLFSRSDVDIFERDSWCKLSFKENLPSFSGRTFDALTDNHYDFVVIDDAISRLYIHRILGNKELKVIFIEGWRNNTVAQISRRMALHGFAASYERGTSQLFRFGTADSWEKSGSWFVLEYVGFRPATVTTWIKRLRQTDEFNELLKEFHFWLRRRLRLRSRLDNLVRMFR